MGAPGVLWTQVGAVWYGKRNPFSRIRDAGGNHFVTVSGEWITVSDTGTLHLQPGRFPGPVSIGGNFLLEPVSGRIHAVDAWGYPVDSRVDAGEWKALGWNWLVTRDGVLITVRKSGMAPGDGTGMVIRKSGWDFGDVRVAGGTFLIRADGRVVTISEITGHFRDWDPIGSGVRSVGGNHLIDGEYRLWTVDEDGHITWDGNEKFYCYDEWLSWLIENVLKPWGYVLNGTLDYQGEDDDDFGRLIVVDNVVTNVFQWKGGE
jgi:hypothetical protein